MLVVCCVVAYGLPCAQIETKVRCYYYRTQIKSSTCGRAVRTRCAHLAPHVPATTSRSAWGVEQQSNKRLSRARSGGRGPSEGGCTRVGLVAAPTALRGHPKGGRSAHLGLSPRSPPSCSAEDSDLMQYQSAFASESARIAKGGTDFVQHAIGSVNVLVDPTFGVWRYRSMDRASRGAEPRKLSVRMAVAVSPSYTREDLGSTPSAVA